MKKGSILYAPKGGMCTTCDKRFNDCSDLNFNTMMVINVLDDGTHIVKCTDHFKDRKVEDE